MESEIEIYNKHVKDIVMRHFGNAEAQRHVKYEKILEAHIRSPLFDEEKNQYSDYFSRQTLEELNQRSISPEQLAMESIILHLRGAMLLGSGMDEQGRLHEGGKIISNATDEIVREARQKGYTLVLTHTTQSRGCFAMIIGLILVGATATRELVAFIL